MKELTKLVIALVPVLFLMGCPSKAPVTGGEEEAQVSGGGQVEDKGPEVTTITPPADTGKVQDDLLSETKIYFDFDKSDIKPEFREIVAAHANYLAANPGVNVTIEGHCDERGTREYNMALGERRAHAILRLLTLQGVSKDQIRTVSFGEEQPEVEGHDESAWKWNRRAVFTYDQ